MGILAITGAWVEHQRVMPFFTNPIKIRPREVVLMALVSLPLLPQINQPFLARRVEDETAQILMRMGNSILATLDADKHRVTLGPTAAHCGHFRSSEIFIKW